MPSPFGTRTIKIKGKLTEVDEVLFTTSWLVDITLVDKIEPIV